MKPLALALACAALLAPARAAARPPWDSIAWWGDLEGRERVRIERLAQQKRAYGECTDTVAACFERGSRIGWRLARLIIYLVQKGATDEDVGRIIEQRKASATGPVRTIDVTHAPLLGDAAAKVTIVEFADFECPYCAAVTPLLKEVIEAAAGKARLYFKNFPLKGHRNSLGAALAAVAAGRTGKFWDMAHLLFENLDAHEPKHLEAYAQKLGIALDSFRGLLKAPATLKVVEQDKEAGLRLGVHATPTLYVNGREFQVARDRFLIQDRVEEEIDRLAGRK